MSHQPYDDFLRAKIRLDEGCGFPCEPGEVHGFLKPHQRDVVCWAVRGGRRAVFMAFGLGKTVIQLEVIRLMLAKSGKARGLIVLPLGVRQEFVRDAGKIGMTVKFVRTDAEAVEPGIYLTNYESVREGKIDPRTFDAVSLDEAAILRGFGGTKTFREFMRLFEGTATFRFVATATPSPNEFIELLAYAAFLDVMDVGQAKTRFFKRDSTKADSLTIHAHKEQEFWMWVASWAIFVQSPADLGHSDEGYALPALKIQWHELPSDHSGAGHDRDGQGRLLRDTALGVVDASREKRDSMDARIAKVAQLVGKKRKDQLVIWCDLNDEQRAIESTLDGLGVSYSSLIGSDSVDEREVRLNDWRDRKTVAFLSKPIMYGSGVNLQQAHTMIFAGIGFKFSEVIQAVHRIYRFLQEKPCTVHLIYTEAEREVRRQLEQKWKQHEILVGNMTAIIRQYGLSHIALAGGLNRSMGVERREESGKGWTLVHNDSVIECASMKPDSVGLILTSIPFSTQYEYSPSYNDFGHTDDTDHFFRQMDYLTPNLFRVLQPGRLAVIHVKDRISPGGLTGLGFQSVQPFHADCIYHYRRHGFAYLGMKTIVTDVVRENNQTYRLGWTEQCKDGSRMGVGMPEYLLLFRKPPTDSSNGYADVPVVKDKAAYSRGRWQLDAHGFARSSGNRLLAPEDLNGLKHDEIFRLFRNHSMQSVYDFEQHVKLCESLEDRSMLPVTFMLLQPASWHEDVWHDVTRMRTLNTLASQKGKEMHLCPMQFDIAERVINQMSNPGDVVFDPFAGLGTVPIEALKLGRRGLGCELSPVYFTDSIYWARNAEQERTMPTLFDLAGTGRPEPEPVS